MIAEARRELGWILASMTVVFGPSAAEGGDSFPGEVLTEEFLLGADDAGEFDPAFSPDGSRIAFDSNATGDQNLYVVTLEDGTIEQVTTDPGHDGWPAWSPDGNTLVFASDRDGGRFHLFAIPAEGGAVTQLTFGASDEFDPEWAPNEDWIVYVSNPDGPPAFAEMMRLPVGGGDPELVVEASFFPRNPSFSPDGLDIVFRSDFQGDVLYRVPTAGGEVTVVSDRPGFKGDPNWSPAETGLTRDWVLYAKNDGPVTGDRIVLYLYDPYSGADLALTSNPDSTQDFYNDWHYVEDIETHRVVYETDRDRDGDWDLWLVEFSDAFVAAPDPALPPEPVRLLSGHPNPFRVRATIAFTLDDPGHATLEVFDPSGRRVRHLAHRRLGAGDHVFGFDGADVTGRPLPAGRYFARLTTEHGVESIPLTLIR